VKIIDYTLDSLTPANPDASCPATVTGCTVVAGPGATTLGTYPNALDFGASGRLNATLPLASLDANRFCVRVVFTAGTNPVAARETLVESDALPFALSLVPGSGGSDFHLVSEVTTGGSGRGSAATEFFVDLHLGTWYTADLVYDTDTLGVFVDGVIYSVHAFPEGTLAAGTGDQLLVGTSSGGTDPFTGAMAALQLHDDIPIELESQLDERRSHPQWYLTWKQEEIKFSLAFGEPSGEFYLDLPSASWIQEFAGGIVMYHDGNGQAYEMHGAILQAYRALGIGGRMPIGSLISDELDGAQGGSRKSLFTRGGIYWSNPTGAVPVVGQIWVDYEGMGESGALGLPVSPAVGVGGGARQEFQHAQMYLKSGASKAFEVHGAILGKFLSSGATAVWGFPVSNEGDLTSNAAPIGRTSEFEGCTIYWSAGTGAFEAHGDIRDRYRSLGGPAGNLGFPTSDETDVPGAGAPARYNTFQNGSIVWFGSTAETYVCVPFDINLGRVDTVESEGWGRGQNDVYMNATLADNGHVIHAERIPSSGDSDGNNIYDVEKTFDLGPVGIVPNDPNRIITFGLDVWDSDWPDDDDHLGDFEATLDMANAWGLRGNPSGLMNSGAFDNINSITWSVSPHVREDLLTEAQKWWGVKNRKTDPLTWDQYASAFSDVDSETEWWDPTDWLAKLFYVAVVKGLASHGNCFGMSLEAIYSKKDRAFLRLPLDRFTEPDWEQVRNEFNIKHQYQVGAPAIWWFVGQFLSGQTHDPVSVFHATRDAYYSGCDPVVCISQNYDFGGAPHCILPVGWDDSVTPWRMLVHDPNFPSLSSGDPGPRPLYVDPGANTYTYDGSHHYHGTAWSGGRFHYMPFDVVNERPRTPIYDALMLLLSGAILIVGADSETTSLTDANGVDLDAFGADSVARLQAGASLTNKFVSVKGFDVDRRECAKERTTPQPKEPHDVRKPRAHGVLTSEVYMRSDPRTFSRKVPPNKRSGDDWTRVTLKEYLCQLAPARIREQFARHPEFVSSNQGRLMFHLTESELVKEILGGPLAGLPAPAGFPGVSKDYVHTTRGLRSGRLEYGVKQGLTQLLLSAETAAGETHVIQVKDLGTHTNAITVKGYRDKVFSLVVDNKLGAGRDHLRVTIDGIPLAAGGEVEINVKPGIGGIELVAAGQPIRATVSFDYVRRGSALSSRFELDGQDGVRIVPSTFITDNRLKVSRIATLFGDSVSSRLVDAMP
jgi:LGFP repeat-containing protein/concanavalin A-like lectin/glucanase superfamily protein